MPAGKRAGGEVARRREIVETCRTMNALGINHGPSGNVSARCGGRLLITPSGVPYETLSPDDIEAMPVDPEDAGAERQLAPCNEWRSHPTILRTGPEAAAEMQPKRPPPPARAHRRRGSPPGPDPVVAAG